MPPIVPPGPGAELRTHNRATVILTTLSEDPEKD